MIFWVYLSPERIPAKYLVPGTIFLLAFQVFPVLYTVSTAFTNFGDGHRGTKEDAIRAIEGASVQQVAGLDRVRADGRDQGRPGHRGPGLPAHRPRDPADRGRHARRPRAAAGRRRRARRPSGKVTEAPGYTVLTIGQAGGREADLAVFSVPTENGAIVAAGLTRAFEGAADRAYDEACDCITDTETGQIWTADDSDGSFVDADGERLAQGWKVNVGLRNFADVLTDPADLRHVPRHLVWNFAFAALTVAITFVARAPGGDRAQPLRASGRSGSTGRC